MDRNDTMQVIVIVMDTVALRKESVDRNALWLLTYHRRFGVALRKESVDRNVVGSWPRGMTPCRSPQGERG